MIKINSEIPTIVSIEEFTEKVRIVCLMTNGRSGSKLFHSLLDNHPQIICFPRSFLFNKFWMSAVHRKDDLNFLIDSFVEKFPRFFSGKLWYQINHFDRADQLGENKDETFSVDIGSFKENILRLLKSKEIRRETFFIAVHLAYRIACNKEIIDNSIILYHIHSTMMVDEIKMCLSDFSNKTKLIVMCRHPVESINSSFEILKMRNLLSLGNLFHHEQQVILGELPLRELFPELDIRVLPFEHLHLSHKDIMQSFINWIGINWDDNLMLSTMHGKLWWGNGAVPRNGTNPKWKIYQPSKLLEKKDWKLICCFFSNRMKKFGYIKEDCQKERISKLKLSFLLILPTYAEWSALKCFFSLKYWINVIKKINIDLNDPRLKDFDYYTLQKLSDGKQISNKDSRPKRSIVYLIRFSGLLLRQFRILNPLSWFYYTTRRIIDFNRIARKCGCGNEKIPNLLLDISTNHNKEFNFNEQ